MKRFLPLLTALTAFALGAVSFGAPAIVQAAAPESAPVTGAAAGGNTADYYAGTIGLSDVYTHPNGVGSDWAKGDVKPFVGKNSAPLPVSAAAPAVASHAITQAPTPESLPTVGSEAGGATTFYLAGELGKGDGYTHPNGIGSAWAAEQASD